MDAETTIREYYAALREGDPLPPFFAEDSSVVKFGITDRLSGYTAIADGLREQTATTVDWTVTSHRLSVIERERHACFADAVRMAWTDAETGARRNYETRWSGTLERRDGEWRFVGMHVSAAEDELEDAESGFASAGEGDDTRTSGR